MSITNTDLIVSLGVIFGIIGWIFYIANKQKEGFEQLEYTNESYLPYQLKETSSINTVSLSTPIIDISTNKKTYYGKLISSIVPSSINEYLYIDETNIDYIKNKVINISKPVKINVTNIVTSNFPIKLFFYNSTKSTVKITIMFTDTNATLYSDLDCVSNYMTNDINRIKLSIDTSSIIQNSLIIRKNFLNKEGIPIFYRYNTWLDYGRLSSDVDEVIKAPEDVKTIFTNLAPGPAPGNISPYVKINVSSSPSPTHVPSSK